MGEFLSYLIISGLFMLVLYLTYRLFLARDNQHGFNRGVLLGIYFVSFLTLPAITVCQKLTAESIHQEPRGVYFFANPVEVEMVDVSKPIWGTILIWLFIAGAAVVLARTLLTWLRLIMVIRSGEKVGREGYTLVVTDDERFAPFSWMHYVVVSRKDFDNNYNAIATHELKHIAAHHWRDLLLAQIVCIINWFNPAAWLMRDELMLVHEYQADMAVIEHGNDPREYQMLLIKKAVGARFPSLANSPNHSKLKKRITMMYKEKSGAGRKLKALALVPMLALAVGLSSVPAIDAAVSTISDSGMSLRPSGEGYSGVIDAVIEHAVTEAEPSDATSPADAVSPADEADPDVVVDSGAVTADKDSKSSATDKEKALEFSLATLITSPDKTEIVCRTTVPDGKIKVSGATLKSDGKTYQTKNLKCDMTGNNAVITATFPAVSNLVNPIMVLTVNGAEYALSINAFSSTVKTVVVSDDGSAVYSAGSIPSKASSKTTVFKKRSQSSQSTMPNGAKASTLVLNGDDASSSVVVSSYDDSKNGSVASTIVISDESGYPSNPSSIVLSSSDSKSGQYTSTVVTDGNNVSLTGNMKIILDGKEIPQSELSKLDPQKISSITVDKPHSRILITTLK